MSASIFPIPLSVEELTHLATSSHHRRGLTYLAEYLRSEHYGAAEISSLVGAAASPTRLVTHAGHYSLLYSSVLRAEASPVAALGSLFWLNTSVQKSVYKASLPDSLRQLLESLGLVHSLANEVSGRVSMIEFDSLFFLADQLYRWTGPHSFYPVLDRRNVMPPHASSLSLYGAADTFSAHKSLLDVGCGCGCLSMLLFNRYSNVMGIDIDKRAVGFSHVNNIINRTEISFLTADAFSYQAGRYDHVIFNAPWGPQYDKELDEASSEDALDYLARFVTTCLPVILRPGGTCQFFSILYLHEGGPDPTTMVGDALSPNWSVELIELMDSPFRLSAEDIENNHIPRGCYLVRDFRDGERLLRFLHQRQIREVCVAIVNVRAEPQA